MQKVGTLQIFEKKPKKRLWCSLFALFYFSAVKLKKKGLQSGDKMEVYGDLKTGEQVVTKASDEIRDGSGVKDKL